VLASMTRSLAELAQANSNNKLASKWFLLATTVSADPTSSNQKLLQC
jgi:hypothetical protein